MPELPNHIQLIIEPEGGKLLIDGAEFPYEIAAEDIELHGHVDSLSYVRVSILANKVSLSANLGSVTSKPEDPETASSWNGEVLEVTPEWFSAPPKLWGLGYEFTLDPNQEPPASVLAIEEPDTKFCPFLVRAEDGWGWVTNPSETPRSGTVSPWNWWARKSLEWIDKTFTVVGVNNDE